MPILLSIKYIKNTTLIVIMNKWFIKKFRKANLSGREEKERFVYKHCKEANLISTYHGHDYMVLCKLAEGWEHDICPLTNSLYAKDCIKYLTEKEKEKLKGEKEKKYYSGAQLKWDTEYYG